MLPAIIVVAVIAVDQISKLIIRADFELGESLSVIPNFFNITYVRNTGTAFSMFENNQWVTIGLTGILILICLYVIIRDWRKGSKPLAIAMSFVLAGGLSNLIDRIVLGYVTDMFSFGSFAIFNVADIAVTCGCAFAIIVLFFFPEEDRANLE